MYNSYAFNAFAGQLISHFLSANETGNFIISPVSLSTCLGMLLLGCQNNSTEQLLKFLQVKSSSSSSPSSSSSSTSASSSPSSSLIDNLFKDYKDISTNYASKNSLDTIILLNKALIHSSSKILPSYKQNLQSNFLATIDPLDKISYKSINEWVNNATNGNIKSIIDTQPDPLTRLILLNAIYFKGNWTHQFPKENTEMAKFSSTGDINDDNVVSFMSLPKTKLNYGEIYTSNKKIGIQVVELPYEGSTSMIIFLPMRPHSPNSLVANDTDALNYLLNSFDSSKQRQDVIVKIPKFKIEKEISLLSTMKQLGASDLVTSGLADLSGIDGSKELYVSDVVHKAAIEVNEEGSEAAASSSVVISMRSFTFIAEFIADRPFLFVIRDSTTNLTLFAGKVVDP